MVLVGLELELVAEVPVVADVDDDVGVVELDLPCAQTPFTKKCKSIYA